MLFKKYSLHLHRRYPAYKATTRRHVMLQDDDLEQLLKRAERIKAKGRSPWATYSFCTNCPEFTTLVTFNIEE